MLHKNVRRMDKREDYLAILTINGVFLKLTGDKIEFFNECKEKEKFSEIKSEFRKYKEYAQELVNLDVLEFEDVHKDDKKIFAIKKDRKLMNYFKEKPAYEFPIVVHLGISKACNANCIYCSVRESQKDCIELSKQEWIRVLEKFKDFGAPQVGFTGGEPLLRMDILPDLIKHSLKLGFGTNMTTNGILVNDKNVKKLVMAGLEQCQISLDSHIEEVNDNLRGRGMTKIALKAIKTLQKHGIVVGVDTVVSSKNVSQLYDFAEFLDSLGVEYLTLLKLKKGFLNQEVFRGMIPEYEEFGKQLLKISNSDLKIQVTVDCAATNNMQVFTKQELLQSNIFGCPIGHTLMVVNPNGDLYPCVALMNEEFRLGNITKDNLAEIWYKGKKLKELRRITNYVSDKCTKCSRFEICRASCRGTSYELLGNLKDRDPTCGFRGKNKKIFRR